MVATLDIDSIVPSAYHKEDGSLCLPVHHWESDDLLGWQVRVPGKAPKYTQGIQMSKAAPLRIDQNSIAKLPIIVTEGPTDAIAVKQHEAMDGSMVVGCWSASTLPPSGWFDRFIGGTFIACGDGDKAGKMFNQKLADIVGYCWPLRIPDGMDVRALLEASGCGRFESIVSRSLLHEPLQRRQHHVNKREINPVDANIADLIEQAGGRLASKLANGGRKYYCPLHADKLDPSLTADVNTGAWMCWAGCGKGYPAQWVMAWRGCDYRNAMTWLGRHK